MTIKHKLSVILSALLLCCLSQVSRAADCTQMPLTQYIAAGFDCTIGDKEFSDFTYAQNGTFAVAAANITVMPIDTALNPGIEFFAPGAGGFSTPAGMANQSYTGTFGYLVTVLPDGADINDVTLFQLGGHIVGSGTVSVDKKFCATGGTIANCPVPPGGVLPGIRTITVTTTTPSVTVGVNPAVDIMGIQDILKLATGNDMISTGSLSAFANQVSEVPEPSTWATMLIGFAGLGLAGYRARRRAAALSA